MSSKLSHQVVRQFNFNEKIVVGIVTFFLFELSHHFVGFFFFCLLNMLFLRFL